jgi:hypothetical protein
MIELIEWCKRATGARNTLVALKLGQLDLFPYKRIPTGIRKYGHVICGGVGWNEQYTRESPTPVAPEWVQYVL